MRHGGNTKRTDKALKVLQQIVKANKKYEGEEIIKYEKVNDDSE